jgi:hypothetical protein
VAVINPVGFLANRTDHTAQIDRLSGGAGLLLPDAVGSLRSKGGLRAATDCQCSVVSAMQTKISAGIVYVPALTPLAGTYTVPNDGDITATHAASDPTNSRRDLWVARVKDQQYTGAANIGSIEVLPGTASSSPADPVLPADSAFYVIARVTVRPGNTILITDITYLGKPAQLVGGQMASRNLGGTVDTLGPIDMQMGVLRIVGNNTGAISAVVTFPVPFAGIPIVFVSPIGFISPNGGAFTTAMPTNWEGWSANIGEASTTQATIRARRNDGATFGTAVDYYLNWLALGVKA